MRRSLKTIVKSGGIWNGGEIDAAVVLTMMAGTSKTTAGASMECDRSWSVSVWDEVVVAA